MSILVVGGAGFVGRDLVRNLIDYQYRVVVLDNLTIEPSEKLPLSTRCYLQIGDCRKPNDIKTAIMSMAEVDPIEYIYWLAAKQGYDNLWSEFGSTNVNSAYGFFEMLPTLYPWRPKRIILASSQAIYSPATLVREYSATIPPSVYGMSKLCQEKSFFTLAAQLKIPVVALRYSIILGRGQSLQSTESGILRNWYRAWVEGREPEIYGDGCQIRDFVHISDVTKANILALTSSYLAGGGVLNIGGIPSTIIDVAEIFHQETGCRKPRILNNDVRPGGEYSLTSDSHLANTYLKWAPTVTLKEQIHDFVTSVQ
jgi:UDP-glucose 4-epimerase